MKLEEARLLIEQTIPFVHDQPALADTLTRLRDSGLLEIIGRWPPEEPTGNEVELEEYRRALDRAIAAAAKAGASPGLLKKLRHLLRQFERQLQGDQDAAPDAAPYDDHGGRGDEAGSTGIVGPWED